MRKIVIEVGDYCFYCKKLYTTTNNIDYLTQYKCGEFNENIEMDMKPCPSCLAAEVDNLFNKHLENVLKEEKEK